MGLANNVFVIAVCALLAVYYIAVRRTKSPSREVTVVLAGLAIVALFAIENNLAYLIVLPQHEDFEPIGFFIFVCCLGYVTARRALAKEERLLAINKELQIANQIQASILPREVPQLAGPLNAALFMPMNSVAGVFYDFLCVDERRIGIVVADVTGGGVTASLIAYCEKVAVFGQTAHADDPVRVL